MALKLSAPIEKEFVLEKTDEVYGQPGDEPTRIRVKQATQADHERRSQIWDTLTQEVVGSDMNRPEAIRLIQKLSVSELNRIEVFLTLKSCNILDENDKELFKFDKNGLKMSEIEFQKAWGKLPPMVANEIHDKVREVNFTWKPRGEES